MKKYDKNMLKSVDVYNLIKSFKMIGWKTLRESSINRIMYLSAVLYSFIHDSENVFCDVYHFTITLSGPEDTDIENALVNLESNDIIINTEDGYKLNGDNIFAINKKSVEIKKQWFEDIAYIVGLYGEDKIYDFIFRDPEYRESLQGNSIYNLNVGKENATVNFLIEFKKLFEAQLNCKGDTLDNRKYMELYFEYVFGMIIRGER